MRLLLDTLILCRLALRATAKRAACWGALAAILLLLASCGYSPRAVYPEDIRSVTVPIFENRGFYRGVEFDVSEALVKEIELRTPYKVTGAAGADTILQGTISSVGESQLSRRRQGGLPQEMEVHLTVSFQWKNLRTGQVLRERRGFEVVGRYVPARGVNERLAIGEHSAAQRLAEAIVAVMQSDW